MTADLQSAPLATRAPLRESRLLRLVCQRTCTTVLEAGGGNRTRCLLITSQPLYRVSYASMGLSRTRQPVRVASSTGCGRPCQEFCVQKRGARQPAYWLLIAEAMGTPRPSKETDRGVGSSAPLTAASLSRSTFDMSHAASNKPWSLSGRTCLITGITQGIGRITALELAKTGCRLLLVARDERRGAALVDEIKALRRDTAVELLIADLSAMAQVRRLAGELRRGPIAWMCSSTMPARCSSIASSPSMASRGPLLSITSPTSR